MNDFFTQYFIYILSFAIVMIAQSRVQAAYQKYKAVRNENGITGFQTARKILDANGLQNIQIELSNGGVLSDHYDPSNHIVRLSSEVYNGTSIASVSVAAHEVGHAIQHKEHYGAIGLRNRLLPLASIASRMGWLILFVGLFLFATTPLILYIGIALILVILLFQIATLPIEFNASNRAIKQLSGMSLIREEETPMVKGMLNAAAFTYVAAVLSTIAQLLRILLIVFSNRRNNN